MVSQCRPPAHLSTTNHVVLASHRLHTGHSVHYTVFHTLRTHALPFNWAPVFYWKDTAFYNCTMYLVNPSIPLYTPVCPFIPRYTTFESHFFPLCESESLLLVISWHQNWYCGYATYLLLLWVLWLHTSGYCRYCAHRSLQATCHQPIISSVHHQHFFFQLEPQHFCQQSFKCSWHRAHNANVWNM